MQTLLSVARRYIATFDIAAIVVVNKGRARLLVVRQLPKRRLQAAAHQLASRTEQALVTGGLEWFTTEYKRHRMAAEAVQI